MTTTIKNWVIIPYVTGWDVTLPAIQDCLAQDLPDVGVLFINQGFEHPIPADLLRHPQFLVWRHYPPMLSLSATWNRALHFVWAQGLQHALVLNNDVRIHPCTYRYLVRTVQNTEAWLVTATGVTKAQYEEACQVGDLPRSPALEQLTWPLPGPDFSCFLATQEGHLRYPFDEQYIPAFCEDIDLHRRYMLGGDGQKIFGTGLPYYHIGSNTIKSLPDDKRRALESRIEAGSRAYHRLKWGGAANQERYIVPFGHQNLLDRQPSFKPDWLGDQEGVTTPELFERVRHGQPALV